MFFRSKPAPFFLSSQTRMKLHQIHIYFSAQKQFSSIFNKIFLLVVIGKTFPNSGIAWNSSRKWEKMFHWIYIIDCKVKGYVAKHLSTTTDHKETRIISSSTLVCSFKCLLWLCYASELLCDGYIMDRNPMPSRNLKSYMEIKICN